MYSDRDVVVFKHPSTIEYHVWPRVFYFLLPFSLHAGQIEAYEQKHKGTAVLSSASSSSSPSPSDEPARPSIVGGTPSSPIEYHRVNALLRLLTPLSKLYTAKATVIATSEALESFGALGYAFSLHANYTAYIL